ncbi:unnamed protein product [Didymodactylos carnosus]|uniref:RNA-dependent RNA polymerase n=1 Tax=Didymodactylos carnosus TaxID=1234261 RepID=A0A8S2KYJ2_9BILA|nr:unnamed protein product [Didymodactylos carnosus]CAF3875524.1 unnamed protein product [Didymodactylos carnosus]
MNNDARAVLHLLSRRSSSGTDEDQHENEELDINNNAIAKEDNEDNFYEEGYDERSLEQSHKCISDSDYTSSSILTLYNHHKRDSTRIDQQNPSMQRRADSVCKFVEPASISRGRGIYRRSVTSLDINNESKSNFSHPTSNGYLNDRRSPPPPHWPVTKTGLTYESKISPIFKNNYTFTTAALTTRQCSVDVQSIDFSFKIRDLSIIINSDDLKTCKGYEKACVLLKSKRLAYTGLNTYPDIWHFNLWKYKIQFLPIQTKFCPRMPINVDDLEYPTFPIQELTKWMKNDHYWFMIKDQPKFIDTYFNETKSSMPESTIIKSHTKLGAVSFKETIHLELSYGALISQTHYVEHPKYVLKKKSKWYIAFYQRKFEIVIQNNRLCKRVIKQIPVELIDRTAIFKLEQNSFTLYLCMRGNVHEYESTTYTNNNNSKNGMLKSAIKVMIAKQFSPNLRRAQLNFDKDLHIRCNHQPKATTSQTSARRRISRLMPTFSTTRLTVSCKADEMSQEYFKNRKNNNNTRHEQHFDLIKQESFAQIKELFKHLLNFFYSNTIQVCFAAIQNKDGITNCSSILFPTRLQTYAFQMLNDIGYRVQYNIYQSQLFCEQMKQIACQKNKDYEINLDDRFYCLCMYLHCRLSESHFADLMGELTAGIKEYKNKLERSFLSGIQMPSLNTSPKPNHLYIYSVTITPTTICTKPIKLCKTNRILREELFGSKMNFALVELRDEANKPLYKQTFLDIREVLNNYLTKGFRIVEYQYKYLHHSQSQVKDKQFWSYCDEQQCGGISIEAAYSWMGNFDNEKVVAKHSARIALCFTSTSPTIKVCYLLFML